MILEITPKGLVAGTEKQFTFPKTLLTHEVFGKLRGSFVECLSDFLDAIINDTEPKVTAFDGRQVTAVLDAASRSLVSGQTEAVTQAARQQNVDRCG